MPITKHNLVERTVMILKPSFAVAFALSCFGGLAHSDTTFDVAADFSPTSNPAGAWQYGWSNTTTGSPFNLDIVSASISGLDVWQGIPGSDAFGNPTVLFNPTSSPIFFLPPLHVALHPGPVGQNSVVRWIAVEDGSIAINASFEGINPAGTTTDVHILRNGVAIFDSFVNGVGPGSVVSFASAAIPVAAGDAISFSVGFGANGAYDNDWTQLDATIVHSPVSELPSTALLGAGLSAMVFAISLRQRKREA